jgi:multiple sugar transport system substrate-binding protein
MITKEDEVFYSEKGIDDLKEYHFNAKNNQAVIKGIKSELSEAETKIFDYVEKASQNVRTMNPIDPLGNAEIMKALDNISEQILFKKMTPEDGVKSFRKQAKRILGKNK